MRRTAEAGSTTGWPGAPDLELSATLADLVDRTTLTCTHLAVLAGRAWRHELDRAAAAGGRPFALADRLVPRPVVLRPTPARPAASAAGDDGSARRPERPARRRRLFTMSAAAVLVALSGFGVAAGRSDPGAPTAAQLLDVPARATTTAPSGAAHAAAVPVATPSATAPTVPQTAPSTAPPTTVPPTTEAPSTTAPPTTAPPTTAPPTTTPAPPAAGTLAETAGPATPATARQERKTRPSGTDVPIGDVGWDVALPAPHQAPPHVDRDDLVRQLQRKGWVNGQIAESALADVDGCTMLPAAADAWKTMKAAAAADGITLGSSECYRSIGEQVAARDSWCATDDCRFAAEPGRSLHGWGLAVDVTAGGHTVDFSSPEYAWMAAHGADYGFYHPEWADPSGDAPEPWHWEYQAPI